MDIERPYWNMEVESRFNTPEMREIQNDLLLRHVQGMYDRVPLNRKRMDEAGVKPSDIRSLDDLSRISVGDLMTQQTSELLQCIPGFLPDGDMQTVPPRRQRDGQASQTIRRNGTAFDGATRDTPPLCHCVGRFDR